jgi:site-specific DNA recombinase
METKKALQVVVYLRQSDKEQRLSIDQQRKEVSTYAQSRGWVVAKEFVDDGKSGSKNIKARERFHALIADAESPDRNWDAILCWDTSRFGRLDALTGAEYKQRLRKAGVWLETTRGEKIDWGTSMGRIMDTLQSENNHEYSLSISRNVIRGRRAILDMGYMATKVPFGFDRQYVEGGKVQMVVPRTKMFSKPRNWHLLPIRNENEAKIVKWLFDQWHKRDLSFGATIKMLMEKNIPSPSGQPSWTLHQLRGLLTDRTYVGDAVIGGGEKTREVHGRIGEMIKENAFEGIVDRSVFEEVQRKVQKRRCGEWKAKTNSGPLSGLLKCGHCDYTLARRTYKGKDGIVRQKYVCESQMRRPHLGCKQWRVDENEVLPIICEQLIQSVDLELLNNLATKSSNAEVNEEIERLKTTEAKLRRQVEKAAENLLLIDKETIPLVTGKLNAMRAEHEKVVNMLKIAQAENENDKGNLPKKWRMARQTIEMAGKVATYKPHSPQDGLFASAGVKREHKRIELDVESLRALLRQLNVECSFFWTRKGSQNWALVSGTLKACFSPNVVTEQKCIGIAG